VEISVDRELLPENEHDRNEFLKKYFCELTVSAKEAPKGWVLSLGRPTSTEFYIDPGIVSGLDWWSKNYGKVDVAGIPFAHHRRPGMQLSLNDSWTIYSWSRWLKQSITHDMKSQAITLLHVDDHDDLMTPRIVNGGEAWVDSISGLALDLWLPETVASAVRSGAIGIGSFMSPLLHLFPSVNVRHLCSTEYSKDRQGAYSVRTLQKTDELLAPGGLRPALKLERVDNASDSSLDGGQGHPYIVTDDLIRWVADLPEGPILIHIDMDYFNNRFNGDSNWVDDGPKYDPPLKDVLRRIDQLFYSLESEGVAERVIDFAVALSPGFFPTDLWAPSIEMIQNHVNRLITAKRWTTRG